MATRAAQTQDTYFRGILAREHPRKHQAGYLREALNVYVPGGILAGRPGLRPIHAIPFPDPIRGHGWHVYEDGTRELIVAAGEKLYRLLPGADPVELLLTSMPDDEQTRATPLKVNFLSISGGQNLTFIYDGLNPNLKYDGVTQALTRVGIKTMLMPPGAPVIAAGVAPNCIEAGKRDYKWTLSSPWHESDLNENPLTVTNTTCQTNTFSSPTDPANYNDPQVTKWSLYRTNASRGSYRFIGTADIGNDITDTTSDAVLEGRTPAEELVNTPPPHPFSALAEHRGQLAAVMIDDLSLVRFSNQHPDYMVPEGWPDDNEIPVAHGDGDRLAALSSMHEWLVAFKEVGTWAIAGEVFEEYKPVPVLAAGGGHRIGIGCFAPGSVIAVENAIMFASRDGVYRIERYESGTGGIHAVRLSGAIDQLYAALDFSLGSSAAFDRKRRVFMWWGFGATRKRREVENLGNE